MNASDNSYAITAEGLIREFGPVRAVDGVDLKVHKSEIFGFLGPNGAGKTTVIRMLVTLPAPTGGSITGPGTTPYVSPMRCDCGSAQPCRMPL